MLEVLVATLGIFGLMLGHVRAYWGDFGKSSVETVANGGKWWQTVASGNGVGGMGGGRRGGDKGRGSRDILFDTMVQHAMHPYRGRRI